MTAPATSQGRIKFGNPPINEVAVSLFYLPILDLKAQHIGLYWNLIRDRYPKCEQQPAVFLAPNDQTFLMNTPGEVFPLPRFWFHSDVHRTLIQVQRNGFMLNWRRLEGSETVAYPHYEQVVQEFWEEFGRYTSFLTDKIGGKIDVLQRCELSYINLIFSSEYFTTLDDVQTILPWMSGLKTLATSDRELEGLNTNASYRMNANLNVEIGVRLGRRTDGGEIALGLDLKAHGLPADLSVDGARAWYEMAHDAIYKTFLESTSAEMQEKLWMPR